MAKQVMVLEITQQTGGFQMVRSVMWFPVPAGKELANPNFNSQWKDIATKDPALLSQLRAGQVLEEAYVFQVPVSLTAAQVQGLLQAAWISRSGYLASTPPQGQFYGQFWDGAVWQAA